MIAPVPLIVGVTGHRDLVTEDIEVVKQQIVSFISELQTRYPETPVLILSGAAEGADTVVIEVADAMDCDVLLILPMPMSAYLDDFTGAAREKLQLLLTQHEVTELPLLPPRQAGHSIDKELQYQQLGSFLAAHSHVLMALWDGNYIDAVGGTSQVVEFHQQDISPLADPRQVRSTVDISDDESDLIYHIVCARQSSGIPTPPLQRGEAHWLSRDDLEPRTTQMPPRYDAVFARLNRFNRDMTSIAELLPVSVLDPAQPATHPCRPIQEIQGASDLLATRYQQRVLMALRITLGAVVLAGLFFILYADFEDNDNMIWGYLVSAGIALASYLWAKKQDWQRCYLDYRVLAEGLRVQYYWALAGVRMSNPSRFSHDSFMQGRDLELGWVRNVMRYAGLRADADYQPGRKDLQAAIRSWIGDLDSGQLGYYHSKAGEKLTRHRMTERLSNACFLAGLLAAVLLAFNIGDIEARAGTWLVAVMGMLPIIAAARQTYAHRLAERELVAQYAHMQEIFANAHRLVKHAESEADGDDQIRTILRDLGEASLNENAQWVLRQRERPLPGGESMA